MNDAESSFPIDEHHRLAADVRCGAIAVVHILERWLTIRSALDLGCGIGVWLGVLRDGGRRQVFGIDFETPDPDDLEVDPDLILTADLSRKLDLHQRYDLVVCLEVAEHIDAQFADTVVDNCVRHGDLILFSAALPGQLGFHHINEQPPSYWAERFQRHGYIGLDLIRPLIWDDPQIPVWYRQNILLFAKDGSSQLAALRANAQPATSLPLALAHPDYMRWFSTQAQIAAAEADAARQRLAQAQAGFDASLGRHRESDAKAQSALAAALSDAARQRDAAGKARAAADAAATDAKLRYEAERQARTAAEAALAAATQAQQAEAASRTEAEIALAQAEQRLATEVAARADVEAALAAATQAQQAEAASRTAAEIALAQAEQRLAAEATARADAETALADAQRRHAAAETAHSTAVRRYVAEIASRVDAEAALATAIHTQHAEAQSRQAADTALAKAVQRHAAETASRVRAEVALAVARRDHQTEIEARKAAETAWAQATRLQAVETVARRDAEAALAVARRTQQASSKALAETEATLSHAVYRANAETTARVTAEAALAAATRRIQVEAAQSAAIEKTLEATRDGQRRTASALTEARTELFAAKHELIATHVPLAAAQQARDLMSAELAAARSEVAMLRWERGVIVGSTLWSMTEPLRRLGRAMSLPRRQQIRHMVRALLPVLRRSQHPEDGLVQQRPSEVPSPPALAALPGPVTVADPPPTPRHVVPPVVPSATRIAYISGEPTTPGHVYRVLRYMEAAKALGIEVDCLTLAEVVPRGEVLARATLIIIWRAPNGPEVAHALWVARNHGVKVMLDVDDLMFDPTLASSQVIDGIRSQGLTEAHIAGDFQRMKEVVVQADACLCTTEELARHLRALDRATFVLPNLFDDATLRTSRLAVRQRVQTDDGIVRIGYAAGTRTHQRDFRNVAPALEKILTERPHCRLVLFREPDTGRALLDVLEYPALALLEAQIEWRDRVPLAELPNELARFDINLSPLEVGNPFCEAKSELKFFEAALVEVCTIASPSGPLRRAIRDGETGWLADTTEEWEAALRALIDDPARRRRMAHAAYLDVLVRFGPQTGVAMLRSVLEQLAGDATAAQAFQLALLRRRTAAPPRFDIPDASVVFESDQRGDADVTVIVPLYNYAQFIEDALQSVRSQTLVQIDLVVVDDVSTDASLQVAVSWARRHATRFNRLLVMRNATNSGLARSRNVGFDAAETPFVLPLDADNRLRADCCASLAAALRESRAAFAYSHLQCFGDADHVIGTEPFSAIRLASSNYIDAMAMVTKSGWATAGGYTHIQYGWEDYDFWCKCVEHGLWGKHVPEVLAEYRVHAASMLRTSTDRLNNKRSVIRQLEDRHGWMMIDLRP